MSGEAACPSLCANNMGLYLSDHIVQILPKTTLTTEHDTAWKRIDVIESIVIVPLL